jgi:FkbM family methyltransferase
MTPGVLLGEGLRWYLKSARHPFKKFIVGHYWPWFARRRIWIRYDDNAVIKVRLGDYLQQEIFFRGYYERGLIDLLKDTLRPDDVFWDVGANIGAITLIAARRCRRVVAFEPDPRSLAVLIENLRLNGVTNVDVVPAALSNSTGLAVLHQAHENNTGMTSLVAARVKAMGEVQVQVRRADDVLKERSVESPDVMKVDVEGAEHLVLLGAHDLLRSGKVRALVFEDRGDVHGQPSNQSLSACLREASYIVRPLAASDPAATDGMLNFLATPAGAPRQA